MLTLLYLDDSINHHLLGFHSLNADYPETVFYAYLHVIQFGKLALKFILVNYGWKEYKLSRPR